MIVVTGAAGFIGANLIESLNEDSVNEIIAVDSIGTSDRWLNLADLRFTEYVDRADLSKWIESSKAGHIEAVVHLGANSDTTVRDFDHLYENNYRYSRQLWLECARIGVPFIYASSAATYGTMETGFDDSPSKLPNLRPINPYGYLKHLFDLWVLEQKTSPKKWAGLKFFNVYGPREQHKGTMSSMVFHGARQARDAGAIRLFRSDREGVADGEQKRDFVYVGDVVKVIRHFLETDDVNGIYNVGTGEARTFNDLAAAVFSATNIEGNIEYIDMPENLKGRYQYYTQADIRRLRGTGYEEAFVGIELGVRLTLGAAGN